LFAAIPNLKFFAADFQTQIRANQWLGLLIGRFLAMEHNLLFGYCPSSNLSREFR